MVFDGGDFDGAQFSGGTVSFDRGSPEGGAVVGLRTGRRSPEGCMAGERDR